VASPSRQPKEGLGMKTKQSIESASISSSMMPSIEPQKLFANLLKVQYPMSQEAPSPEPGPQKDLDQGYRAHMASLIKQYEDEL
jgi:hypothetical protein